MSKKKIKLLNRQNHLQMIQNHSKRWLNGRHSPKKKSLIVWSWRKKRWKTSKKQKKMKSTMHLTKIPTEHPKKKHLPMMGNLTNKRPQQATGAMPLLKAEEATPPIMAENQMGRTEKAVMAGQI